jgi:hypothetical protein
MEMPIPQRGWSCGRLLAVDRSRFWNALLRALEKRGLELEVTRSLSWQEREQRQRSGEELFDNATRVLVNGEWICFGITEKSCVVHTPPPEPPKYLKGVERESWISRNDKPLRELRPNGVLELSIGNWTWPKVRSLWHDGKHKRVEDCLADFVAHLYVTAEAIKKRRVDLERERLERQEAERRRWEEEQCRREEAEREKQFEEKLDCWRLARDAREYVREARALIAAASRNIEEGSPLEQSLKWAESYAERAERRRREKAERAREFQEELERWRLARDIREYVAETRAVVAAANASIVEGGELEAGVILLGITRRVTQGTPPLYLYTASWIFKNEIDPGQMLQWGVPNDSVAFYDGRLLSMVMPHELGHLLCGFGDADYDNTQDPQNLKHNMSGSPRCLMAGIVRRNYFGVNDIDDPNYPLKFCTDSDGDNTNPCRDNRFQCIQP